jgi:hypothetical protein
MGACGIPQVDGPAGPGNAARPWAQLADIPAG